MRNKLAVGGKVSQHLSNNSHATNDAMPQTLESVYMQSKQPFMLPNAKCLLLVDAANEHAHNNSREKFYHLRLERRNL